MGSGVSTRQLEKETATMEKGEQGKSVQCGDTVKGKHKVDMDTLVDIEMSTKGPGHARRSKGSMSSEELTICRTRHTETVITKSKVIKALTYQYPTGRTFNKRCRPNFSRRANLCCFTAEGFEFLC